MERWVWEKEIGIMRERWMLCRVKRERRWYGEVQKGKIGFLKNDEKFWREWLRRVKPSLWIGFSPNLRSILKTDQNDSHAPIGLSEGIGGILVIKNTKTFILRRTYLISVFKL